MNMPHPQHTLPISPDFTNRSPILDIADPIRLRKKGCFQVIAILVSPTEEKEKQISIQQSWLPISDHIFNNAPQTLMRIEKIENIIPVLKETNNVINKIIPTLRKYATEHKRKWNILPIPFLYRPKIFDDLLFNGNNLDSVSLLTKQEYITGTNIEDRLFISLTSGTYDAAAYRKLIEISLSTLNELDIDIAHYGIDLTKRNREIAQDFLVKFPFLVHRIFKKLEKLHVLRYDAPIYGKEETIEFIRYKPEYFQGIINRKYLLDDISHVTT